MAKITIQEVADYAGVSRATVSRVLNENPKVDPALRDQVMAAVKSLGYQPSRAARRLRKPSHDVIGLIVSDIQNPHFVSVIKGVEEAAYVNEMNVILCNSGEDSSRFAKYLHVMRAERVAGLIVVPTSDDDAVALETLREHNIPVVILDREIENFDADMVGSDNEGGAYAGVKHLINLGYKRIAIIHPAIKTGSERFQGYANALKDAGITLDQNLIKVGGHRVEHSDRLTRDFLTDANRPDAIFTATNLMTLGAMHAMREMNARVPDDVALVGFDDIPWAEDLYIPLTAVAQPTYRIGKEAVEMLLSRLENPDQPYLVKKLPTDLIIRGSCGSQA